MIRIAFLSLIFAVALALLLDRPSWAGPIFLLAMGFFVVMLLSGRMRLKCPNCGKRVKVGYNTCHHCGAVVAEPRPVFGQRHSVDEIVKACEHCKSWIRPDASACPHCQRDNPVWTLHDGTWWRQEDGKWLRLNLHDLEWEPFEPTEASTEVTQ